MEAMDSEVCWLNLFGRVRLKEISKVIRKVNFRKTSGEERRQMDPPLHRVQGT